ncbi:MAG: right-handed parallel beta-helix repeat-containing protein, partial [Thermoleophilia bacterium]|nr:right-handed parallel beta-helix repeat-containing protein [Thermoleophilia bacterium]
SNEHTAICVSVNDYGGEPPPRRVVIEGNVIHDCGLLPATNHHHGIYLAGARGALVSGNLIYGNADRGIQLYPDADGSVVVGNVIDGNGSGLIFGGDGSSSSDRNLVAGNIITGSGDRFNIESHWQGPIGEGNVAIGNCLATTADEYGGSPPGSGLEPSMQGVLTFGNAVARPGYEAPTVDAAALVGAFPCGAGGAARG